ncbi:hypothetical protein E0500_011610 [Streptomyces sp. KM273126]|uniref:hypothetical protein n=1 Tax=Streptomyces sp. KM273126 TaxID=2545247 RepID=UPI00103A2383|nr:hypothetical protein [Streptomyces sp. KM273126]MBA2808039.1 hypothetical protein [Streptomyces sp. KM273126]
MDIVLLAPLFGGLVGAGAAYALVRRDVGARPALLVAAATFLALGIGWLFALYGAVVGLVAAGLAYVVTRSRFGTGRALLAAGGSYFAVVIGVAALIFASLETM